MNDDPLSAQDRQLLAEAAGYLEAPSFLIRAATMVGKPAEALIGALPTRAQQLVLQGTSTGLRRGLEWVVSAVPPRGAAVTKRPRWLEEHRHTTIAALAGAGGGFFGVAGLTVELPATTLLMLHAIAAVAAEQGADLTDPETRLQCLAVLSFGSEPLEEMESAYFTARVGLALAVQQASHFLATHTSREVADALARGGAPVLVRFVNTVAGRFQVTVTQKAAAQTVPWVGAAMGAMINAAFTDHFRRVARYHFGIMRLERQYGAAPVRAAYEQARQAHLGQSS